MTRSSPIVPNFLSGWVQLLVPGDCFDEFFIDFNFANVACYQLVLSKLLGFFIVFSSFFAKIPQIMKIYNAKSSEGMSIFAIIFELSVLLYATIYSVRSSFPFSTYGELIFIACQSLVLITLVFHYSGKGHLLLPFFVATGVVFTIVLSPLIPMSVMRVGLAFTTLVGVSGKLLQVMAVYKNGSAGVTSAVTVTMLLLNGIARIYTTVIEVGDLMIIFNYSIVTLINVIFLSQILYYSKYQQNKKDK